MSLFKKKTKSEAGEDIGENIKTIKPKKKKTINARQASQDFVNASKDFEVSRVHEIERSRSIAWRVAIGACVTAICAVVAVMLLTPLKEVRPYVIRVDNNTGQTDIVAMLENSKSNYGEEVAKYFSALYVSLYESYDWYTIQNQIDKLMLFSDKNIQNRINTKFARPDAPHKIYKEGQRVEINVTNTSIIDENGLIQVRFTKRVVPTSGGSYNQDTGVTSPEPIVTNHLATLGYEYVNIPTLDDVRLVNPLGFTVKTYRVDDVTGAQ